MQNRTPSRSRILENAGRHEVLAAPRRTGSSLARAGPTRRNERGKPPPARLPRGSRAVARIQDEAMETRRDPKWSALAAIVAANARCASCLVAPSVTQCVVTDVASVMLVHPAVVRTAVVRQGLRDRRTV